MAPRRLHGISDAEPASPPPAPTVVALALIERSERTWRAIAKATEEQTPAWLAEQLAELRALVEAEFPATRNSPDPGLRPSRGSERPTPPLLRR